MGTLGEAATLTHGEKLDYMRAIVDAAGGRVPVFVGTTCLNTRDTNALTREALALSADGTMLGITMVFASGRAVSGQFYRGCAAAAPEHDNSLYSQPEERTEGNR